MTGRKKDEFSGTSTNNMQDEPKSPKAGLLKERMAQWQQACTTKKEFKKYEELEVSKLEESMTDVNKFQSPVRKAKPKIAVALPPVVGEKKQVFELEMSESSLNNSSTQVIQEYKKPAPPVKKSQEVKDAEEKEAKEELAKLLDSPGGTNKKTLIIPFSAVRSRYMSAVKSLAPVEVGAALQDLKKGTREYQRKKKETIKKEVEKKEKYGVLKNAWDKYEDTAQDKPPAPTEEEKEVQEQVDNAEDDVDKKWEAFAEDALKFYQEADDDSDDDDDDLDFWVNEAKRLAMENMKRRKRKKKKRETAEDEFWKEEALRLREDVRNGNGPAIANGDEKKADEDTETEDADPEEKVESPKAESPSPEADEAKAENTGSKGGDKDSDDDSDSGSDSENGGKNKKGKKKGSKGGDSDSDEDGGKKKKGKKKKGKRGDDSDSDDSDSDSGAKKKKKKKKSKKKSRRRGGDSDSDSDSDTGTGSYSDSDSDSGGKKKKKKDKKNKSKSSDDFAPVTPPKGKNKKVELKDDELPTTPRNMDGTLWKNPLNRWTNKPKKKVKVAGTSISFKVAEKTDCWRKTRGNFIMDNAPFNWHKVSGDFEVMVRVSADFSKMYDKAGIMVRLDEENWILSGLEWFNDRVHHSTSVTRDYTDWSLSQLPENAEKLGIWVCLKRIGSSYEAYYSFDCKKWVQTRQGFFTERPVLQVGVCAACPMGDEYKVNFEYYRVKAI